MYASGSKHTTPTGGKIIEQRVALYAFICVCTSSARMSDYYKSLDKVAKARYVSKLQLLGLDESTDPYISQDFVDNMSLWPPKTTRAAYQVLQVCNDQVGHSL